ncbi:MAG TPA: hypothetical protein VEA63_07840 [Opitutus sp.]|nr:hypothetical protein [Opitutus sp.]
MQTNDTTTPATVAAPQAGTAESAQALAQAATQAAQAKQAKAAERRAKPSKPAASAKPAKPAKQAKQAAKPATAKAKAVKPADPAAIKARAERQAVITGHRQAVAAIYSGASLTVHSSRAAPVNAYVERISAPVQRIGKSGPTTRDNSLLALLARNAKPNGDFDPVALACDVGAISRLASAGFVTLRDGTPNLTKAGRERGNNEHRKANAS